MQTIAIVNEKGGTAKTTTTVNLAACLGRRGQRVLVVDLDGQAATSRWFGVEDDPRLAEALVRGEGLDPVAGVTENVDLAPACGQIDSVAHELRPTQGGQLRKLLAAHEANYDYTLIDCPPSLGNRLIGNALLAASHAIAPVETSILALDGLRMLLTMLGDIRDGFGHDIRLMGILPCRYDARTKLSRLVLAELQRALPEHTFRTIIRANVKLQECPAAQQSILDYAPQSGAAADYANLASEVELGGPTGRLPGVDAEPGAYNELDAADRATLDAFRQRAARHLGGKPSGHRGPPPPAPERKPVTPDTGDGETVGEAGAVASANAREQATPAPEAIQAEASSENYDATGDPDREQAAEASAGRMGRRLTATMAGIGLLAVGLVAWAVFQSTGGPSPASASVAGKAAEAAKGDPSSHAAAAEQPSAAADADDSAHANAHASSTQAGAPATPQDDQADAEASASEPEPASPPSALPDAASTALADAPDAASTMQAMRSMAGVREADPPDRSGAEEPALDRGDVTSDRSGDAASPAAPTGEAPVPPDALEGPGEPRDDAEASPDRDEAGEATAELPRSAKPLPSTLQLSGTIVRPDGGTAVINGSVLRQGESYRGARLIEVRRDWVVLEYRGRKHRLVLGGPAVSIDE